MKLIWNLYQIGIERGRYLCQDIALTLAANKNFSTNFFKLPTLAGSSRTYKLQLTIIGNVLTLCKVYQLWTWNRAILYIMPSFGTKNQYTGISVESYAADFQDKNSPFALALSLRHARCAQIFFLWISYLVLYLRRRVNSISVLRFCENGEILI